MKLLIPLVCLLCVSCASRIAEPREEGSWFVDEAARSGLAFVHANGAEGRFHLPEIMGSGVAVFDYDLDGDLDIYLVQGSPVARGNRLFQNQLAATGRLSFIDVTDTANVGHRGSDMGVAAGDYDSDGDPDLFVTSYGANTLYRNEGNGRFADVTSEAGVRSEGWHTSASFFDYDRDGDLDLFVARYVDFSESNAKTCRGPTGALDYCTPKAYRPVFDRLFRNEGNGTFRDVTVPAGIGSRSGPGLGVLAADFDEDGWPDIYVANDGEANHLWINQRNGTFKEDALTAGVAFSEDGLPQAGMGVSAQDFDLDGRFDIVVTNLTREGATLYRNEGRGFFSDVSAQTGLRQLTFPYTGFGVHWFDLENDGLPDLFIVNGAVTIIEAQRGQPHPFRQPLQLIRLRGKHFVDAGPPGFADVSRGAAMGDIDNDGDLDFVVSNNLGPARLLLNKGSSRNHWLRVVPVARQPSGAIVGALIGTDTVVWRRVAADGSYLSANEPVAHFGLGSLATVQDVRVVWPDGTQESWGPQNANRTIVLKQGTGRPAP